MTWPVVETVAMAVLSEDQVTAWVIFEGEMDAVSWVVLLMSMV